MVIMDAPIIVHQAQEGMKGTKEEMKVVHMVITEAPVPVNPAMEGMKQTVDCKGAIHMAIMEAMDRLMILQGEAGGDHPLTMSRLRHLDNPMKDIIGVEDS